MYFGPRKMLKFFFYSEAIVTIFCSPPIVPSQRIYFTKIKFCHGSFFFFSAACLWISSLFSSMEIMTFFFNNIMLLHK